MMDTASILMPASISSQTHQSESNLAALDATEAPLEEAKLSKGILGSSSPIVGGLSLSYDGATI